MQGTEKPNGPKGEICPQFRRDCSKVCRSCNWWMPVREYSLDGKTFTEGFECAMRVAAFGTLKTATEVRQSCVTMDKMKNNVDKFHDGMAKANMRVINELAPLLRAMTTEPQPALPDPNKGRLTNGDAMRLIEGISDE